VDAHLEHGVSVSAAANQAIRENPQACDGRAARLETRLEAVIRRYSGVDVSDVRNEGFFATLRSSPRKRRRLAWLVAGIVVAVAVLAVVLIVPSTSGTPKPLTPEQQALGDQRPAAGTGAFFWILTVVFGCFLFTLVYGLIRFVWRISVGDADEGAGSDGYTWRNPRKDLEEAMRSSSK
jgi:hypothetical protein